MTYPVYRTKNGNIIKAYVVEARPQTVTMSDETFRGPEGRVGAYATAEEAMAAAQASKHDLCTMIVINTRAANGPTIICTV